MRTCYCYCRCPTSLRPAHYTFLHLVVDGQVTRECGYVCRHTQGFVPQFGNDVVYNFVMQCNTGSGSSGPNTKVFTVKPGQTVSFETNMKAKVEHPGPMQVCTSKAPGSVQEYDGAANSSRYSGSYAACRSLPRATTGKFWGNYQFTFPVPEGIAGGECLMRIEHVAIHRSKKLRGPEMYFSCAQIKIDSDSTSTPFPVVKISGIYGARDPALMFNMYSNQLPTSAPRTGPEITIFSRSFGNGLSPAPVESSAPIRMSTSILAPVQVGDPSLTSLTEPTTFVTSVRPTSASITFQCGGKAPAELTGAWEMAWYA